MNIYIKYILSIFFAGAALPVAAEVRITEIMYDRDGTDSGYEWVEIENQGADAIDLATWSFLENDISHGIASEANETNLEPGEFGIVADDPAKFLEDYPDYIGVLFDSAFSLRNDGEDIALEDDSGAVVDSVEYSPEWGADGNGATLQRQDDTEWIPGLPTPGEENTAIEFIESEEDDENDNDDPGEVEFESPEGEWPFRTEVYVRAGENRRVFAEEEVEFQGEARLRNGDEARNADFTWTFGDGEAEDGERVEHAFDFPGHYSVVLTVEAGGRVYQDRVIIEVVEPELVIESVAPESVTIRNSTSYEMEIGGWRIEAEIEGEDEVVEFPEYTYILPDSLLTVSFSVPENSHEVVLKDASGDEAGSVAVATPPSRFDSSFDYRARIEELFARLNSLSY